jgi:hypothetical protein
MGITGPGSANRIVAHPASQLAHSRRDHLPGSQGTDRDVVRVLRDGRKTARDRTTVLTECLNGAGDLRGVESVVEQIGRDKPATMPRRYPLQEVVVDLLLNRPISCLRLTCQT